MIARVHVLTKTSVDNKQDIVSTFSASEYRSISIQHPRPGHLPSPILKKIPIMGKALRDHPPRKNI